MGKLKNANFPGFPGMGIPGNKLYQEPVSIGAPPKKTAGLTLKAILMDQEASRMKWLTDCGVTPERPFIASEEARVYCMPDPPYLINSLRNHFIDKTIEYSLGSETGTAKWEHVRELYALDAASIASVMAIPKWTEEHIQPSNAKKEEGELCFE
ncbi:hypothetical protein CAPTEDRAFT_191218 [Capitella teleta]|uniref:Uncharacterized protein n=1 Tax=Capitella teleta TaxID=283909 RepID=R7TLC9_CAPTE|nr:hypothetical protein CAPTEDRAFT_191218 [Capitella teleta]|eukprot:ELT92341.1 hypothetical protein CAPTEDRAFT_191218 [Capitella teleta]